MTAHEAETLIAEWQSKGGASFFRLYRSEYGPFYRSTGGGGSLGMMSDADAIAEE